MKGFVMQVALLKPEVTNGLRLVTQESFAHRTPNSFFIHKYDIFTQYIILFCILIKIYT